MASTLGLTAALSPVLTSVLTPVLTVTSTPALAAARMPTVIPNPPTSTPPPTQTAAFTSSWKLNCFFGLIGVS